MKRPLFIFLFSILYLKSVFVFAQPPEGKKKADKAAESPKAAPSKVFKQSRESTINANTLTQQAEILKLDNPSLALEKLEQALKLSIEEKNPYDEAHCYRVLAIVNLQNRLNESGLRLSQKAYNLFQNLNDKTGLNATRPILAQAYLVNNQIDNAEKLFKEHVEFAKASNMPTEEINARYKIAEIYLSQNNKDLAKEQYEQILSIEKRRGNTDGEANANKKIGEIYQSRKQNKRALDYYKEAQDAAGKGSNAKSYSEINNSISEVVPEDEVIDLRKKSLEKSQETKDVDVETKENLQIGNSYLEQNKSQSAIPYLQRSLELADRPGKLKEKGEALKSLSEAYQQQKQFEKAMLTFQKYLEVKDTLIAQKERQIVKMLSSNIALAEQQKQIEFLEKDAELNKQKITALSHEQDAKEERLGRQRLLIYSLTFGLILILISSYLVYKNAQKRRVANQLLALKSLRSQMNPHFIFNALNSVNSFISKNDERSANKYLADFSRLMRMVMENSQHDFVPLSQEISILQLYLALEHFRFQEKFDYTFSVDEDIDADSYEVPPMLIQPYIENAVWHGLRYKEEKGKLSIAFKKNDDSSVSVIIEDDGIGRKKSEELKTENQKTGTSTGIKNTVTRIGLINELYRKNIKIDISDFNPDKSNIGTMVVICLPKKG